MTNYMPILRQRLVNQGMTFGTFYAAQPLCSPNRATVLTGLYPHNHRVLSNDAAARLMRESGLVNNTLATTLQSEGGYRTALIGKYTNGYAAPSERSYVPPGWTRWVGLPPMGTPPSSPTSMARGTIRASG